jgi:hypothetical protein
VPGHSNTALLASPVVDYIGHVAQDSVIVLGSNDCDDCNLWAEILPDNGDCRGIAGTVINRINH